MTAGYPTDAADNAVQANIVSVGYHNGSDSLLTKGTYRLTSVSGGKVLALPAVEAHPCWSITVWATDTGVNRSLMSVHLRIRCVLLSLNTNYTTGAEKKFYTASSRSAFIE